jgi:hypothetical protein
MFIEMILPWAALIVKLQALEDQKRRDRVPPFIPEDDQAG